MFHRQRRVQMQRGTMPAMLLLPAGRRGKTATQNTEQKVVSITGELQIKAVGV